MGGSRRFLFSPVSFPSSCSSRSLQGRWKVLASGYDSGVTGSRQQEEQRPSWLSDGIPRPYYYVLFVVVGYW